MNQGIQVWELIREIVVRRGWTEIETLIAKLRLDARVLRKFYQGPLRR